MKQTEAKIKLKFNTNRPPKDREFLGLVKLCDGFMWEILYWATKQDGVEGGALLRR